MQEPQYHLEGIVHTRSDEMEDFEGPLDVIFLLLSRNKIEIQSVSITAILEQYLAYLDEQKRLDMEIASEFISMASHLMLIKTKMLLSDAEQAEAETELDLLRKSLEERECREALGGIRRAVSVLEPRNEIGRCTFVKQPEPLHRDPTYRYQHEPEDLLRALERISERNARILPPPTVHFQGIVGREPYPVTKKAAQVLHRLVQHGVLRLKSLFRGSRSRSEVVATFLAVLELCKNRSVVLRDEEENPNICLVNRPEQKEDDGWNLNS